MVGGKRMVYAQTITSKTGRDHYRSLSHDRRWNRFRTGTGRCREVELQTRINTPVGTCQYDQFACFLVGWKVSRQRRERPDRKDLERTDWRTASHSNRIPGCRPICVLRWPQALYGL